MNQSTNYHNDYPAPSAQSIDSLIASILADEKTRHLGTTYLPESEIILQLVDELRSVMFPGFFGRRTLTRQNLAEHIETVMQHLTRDLYTQISTALHYMRELCDAVDTTISEDLKINIPDKTGCDRKAEQITHAFLLKLPDVRRLLSLDVQAAYNGDPAAVHSDETIFCYPGVRAIMVHRLAHELYKMNVPFLPRIMSEHAHTLTGVDMHPGASIGESFFIDHGTGVVIGETTVIGNNCKIYQGVTLGGKGFPKDDRGRIIRGYKRHPTLEDNVTVYASATILGGDTVIGEGCVINGGVFLTRSVPPGHIVRSVGPELVVRTNPEAEGFECDASGI